jgi:hypothetical protein
MSTQPMSPASLGVCLGAKVAAIKRCAYSKCGIEFTPPPKGLKAKCCCDDHRREHQNAVRRAATASRRNAHYARYNHDRSMAFDARGNGALREWVGPYRSAKREQQERRAHEEHLAEMAVQR